MGRCGAVITYRQVQWVSGGSRRWTRRLQPAASSAQSADDEGGIFGSVHTNDAQRTSLDQLLEQIRRSGQNAERMKSGSTPLLGLLFTPSYATHATNAKLPGQILQLLEQRESLAENAQLDVVAAVIDRLPSSNAPLEGEEGIAYLYSPHSPPLPTEKQILLNPAAQKPGFITFTVPGVKKYRPYDYEIQTPLAQTVFSTGRVSTLVHTRYNVSGDKELQQATDQRFLESHTLRLPLKLTNTRLSLDTPLLPLTPFRRVRSSMGNIIRAVSALIAHEEAQLAEPEQSDGQPASTELEKAISSYFKAQNIPPEAVQVWAIIIPDALKNFANLKNRPKSARKVMGIQSSDIETWWSSPPNDDPEVVGTMVRQLSRACGARLCKVLSGGGGWGKKAGLLSLDPDPEYSVRDLRRDEGWEFDFEVDGEEAKKKALGEVVKEGEAVAFFVAPRHTPAAFERQTKVWRDIEAGEWGCIFGAIPSSIDALPWSQSSPPAQPRVTHAPNLFGALSEGGLAITTRTTDLPQQRSKEKDVEPPLSLAQTKFDVPFSHLVVKGLSREEHIESEASRARAEEIAGGRPQARLKRQRDGESRLEGRVAETGGSAYRTAKSWTPVDKQRDGAVVERNGRGARPVRRQLEKDESVQWSIAEAMQARRGGAPLRKLPYGAGPPGRNVARSSGAQSRGYAFDATSCASDERTRDASVEAQTKSSRKT